MKKQINVLLSMLILSVILIGNVSAEMLVSEAGVEYESEIIDAFNNQTLAQEMLDEAGMRILEILNNQTRLRLRVVLEDNSGIIIDEKKSKEKRRELIRQIDKWSEPEIEKVLNSLSEEEIQEAEKFIGGFTGYITERGFEKLINDNRVKSIYWTRAKVRLYQNDETTLKDINWLIVITFLTIFIILYIIRKIIKKKKSK